MSTLAARRARPLILVALLLSLLVLTVPLAIAEPAGARTASIPATGVAWAWGSNQNGELGIGTTDGVGYPSPVQSIVLGQRADVLAVAAGYSWRPRGGGIGSYSLALMQDGSVLQWGGGTTDVSVTGISNAKAIAAQGHRQSAALVLKTDGTVWYASSSGSSQYQAVIGAVAIAAGSHHNLALKSDGTVWAWGDNDAAQLGNDSSGQCSADEPDSDSTLHPCGNVAVRDLDDAAAIAAGDRHSLAVKSDGTVWAWGDNDGNLLGTGVTETCYGSFPCTPYPAQVSGLTGVTAVAAGSGFSLALKSDGTVWAWGENRSGQLGISTTASSSRPVQVSGLNGVTVLATSGDHSLALRSDGTLWSWGRNVTSPVRMAAFGGVVAIAAGPSHDLAVEVPPPAAPPSGSDLVHNGSFEETQGTWIRPWLFRADEAGAAVRDGTTYAGGAYSARIDVLASDDRGYTVQLRQENKPLVAGRTYTIRFWAKASAARPIEVRLQKAVSPYTTYFNSSVDLTTSWREYVFRHAATVGDTNAAISFNLAQVIGKVWLDDVVLADLPLLIVSRAGAGSGTVTSAPTGISCGADCAETYPIGTTVTLTAAPDANSAFAGWGGACTNVTGTCTVAMGETKSVTATFAPRFALTVAKAGDGGGTVTSMPAGIGCGSDCAEAYPSGTAVTLNVAPQAESLFAGWAGACSGTGACTVTVDAAKSVTATFSLKRYALAVAKAGTGGGLVTSSPAGIDCGATCSASFASGTAVTLAVGPAAGSSFAGWSGACSGTGGCTVTMTAAKSVTATFNSSTTPSPTNLLRNGSFDATGASWLSPWTFRNTGGSIAQDTAVKTHGAASARVTVTAGSTSTHLVQLRQGGVPLVANRTYTISFWAKASAARNVEVILQQVASPYTVRFRRTVALTTSWQRHVLSYTATASDPNVQLAFNLAQSTGQVWLDGASITDTNLLQNGSFEATGGAWYQPWLFRNDIGASIAQDATTKAHGASSARVTIPTASASAYVIQLRQEGKPLVAGRTYAISFSAKASAARNIDVRLQGAASPFTTYFTKATAITTAWKQYTLLYTATASNPNVFLAFNLAQATGQVWLDDIALVELP